MCPTRRSTGLLAMAVALSAISTQAEAAAKKGMQRDPPAQERATVTESATASGAGSRRVEGVPVLEREVKEGGGFPRFVPPPFPFFVVWLTIGVMAFGAVSMAVAWIRSRR